MKTLIKISVFFGIILFSSSLQSSELTQEFKNPSFSGNGYSNHVLSIQQLESQVVGKHQGAHYFTKGQRKGLAVGGTKEPLFVIETDVDENVIYTGQGKSHPGLLRNVLFVTNDELHWIREDLTLKDGETMNVKARIRYRQPLEEATLHKVQSGLYVEFKNKQSAITEGQFVAWYIGDELVGSGVIS